MRVVTVRRRFALIGLLGVSLLGLAPGIGLATAADARIAVIFPDLGEPYRSVFAKIIEGIEEKTPGKVSSFPLAANAPSEFLAGELKRRDIKVVIALGRNGMKAASTLDRGIEVMVGGVITPPDGETRASSIFSLAPDPALLFGRLKTVLPGVRRITVIYDPKHNGWLVKLAQQAARQQGIEIRAQEASDLRSAIKLYQDFYVGADPASDALWLPQDPTTVDESTVLPLVLKASWNQNIVLFSSSLAHVRRGALFALYPDHLEMGRQLGASASRAVSTAPDARGLVALREVLAALNIRTASHLGLSLSQKQQQTFDLLLPEQ